MDASTRDFSLCVPTRSQEVNAKKGRRLATFGMTAVGGCGAGVVPLQSKKQQIPHFVRDDSVMVGRDGARRNSV